MSGRWAKLLTGPTVPIPGPIPAIQVATELLAVSPSIPRNISEMLPPRKTRKYTTTKIRIDLFVSTLIGLLFSLIGKVALGEIR